MHNIKLSSVDGKAIRQNLEGTPVGGDFELPGLLPGFQEKSVAVMLSEGPGVYTLGLSYMDVPIGKVKAAIDLKGGVISLEVLK